MTFSVSGTAFLGESTTTASTEAIPPLPTSLDDLSPGAREIYDYMKEHAPKADDGSVIFPRNSNGDGATLEPSPFDPENTEAQKALQQEFERLGAGPIDDLAAAAIAKADDAKNGVCSNPNKADGSTCNDGNACTQTDTFHESNPICKQIMVSEG